MNVQKLIEHLGNFGDHLEVVVDVGKEKYHEVYTVDTEDNSSTDNEMKVVLNTIG